MAEDIMGLADAGFSARGSDRLTRPVVSGFRVMATAGTPLTTAAAIRVLSRGGDAIDAGVAAAVAAAVVEPTASYSLPTEVVGLIYDAKNRQVIALNGQGCAPGNMTIELFRSRGKPLIPVGPGPDAPLSFTLPGTIDAWAMDGRALGGTMEVNGFRGPVGSSSDGTTHLSVVDAEGNIFLATPSGGRLNGGCVVPGMGFTLSHRSEIFYLDPNHANALAPGKRPRTTLVCYFVFKDHQPWLTLGCPGGDNQVQADLQLFLNVVEFGMNPQAAVEAARFSSSSFPGSFYPHAYAPGQLNVESGIPTPVRDALALKGHRIHPVPNAGIGAIVTELDAAMGTRSAGADPRRPTYAFGW